MIKPYLEILKLVWPLALGMVNTAVMQFVDRAYLANYSTRALEAILPATTLVWIFLGFFQSITSYSGVLVAQYFGAKDEANCARSYYAGLLVALISGVLVFALLPFGDWLFKLTASSAEIAEYEATYYNIALLGGIFVFGQMAASAYFTGIGQTRIVFWVNLLGNLVNIVLDPILIFGYLGSPKLGIAGAAYATVASQALQFLVLNYAAVRKAGRPNRGVAALRFRELVLKVLRFGIPAGGFEILNMASFTTFVFVTGFMGETAFAASNATFTVNFLLFAPMLGFSLGAQTLVGQARGRGNNEEAKLATKRTLELGIGFIVIFATLVLLLNRPILSLFAPTEPVARAEFMAIGFRLFMFMFAWLVFDAADTIFSGALKGAGDTRFVFWLMFVGSFIVWLPIVFIAYKYFGTMEALWSTTIIYVLVICFGSYQRWHHGKWQRNEVI